jgi:hypothetical protein
MAMTPWGTSFESSPAGVDSPTTGDDSIRQLKSSVRERLEREHINGTEEDSETHGWHREGSAKAYYESAAPTNRPNVSTAPAVALSATDAGRLWIDSDTGLSYVWTGAAWVGLIREIARVSIQGTLAVGTNLVPAIIFPRACTIQKVCARVGTAPTGASLILDINKYGTDEVADGSIFDGVTRPTLAAGDYEDSVTSFHATYSVLAADEYLTIDIDQIGSTVAGADLSITIEVRLD